MSSKFFAMLAVCALAGCSSEPAADQQAQPEPWTHLIPRPVQASPQEGAFAIDAAASISVAPDSPELEQVAELLATQLRRATGFALPVHAGADGDIRIETTDALAELGDEGYQLRVDGSGIEIAAYAAAGAFYGAQTLRQLLPSRVERSTSQAGPWLVGWGTIQDKPRFAWRGLMVDVARHFFTPEDLRRYVDVMAYYKMNRLHLHLTDDQGWRIQIDAWPSLTVIGASTEVGGGAGGFYSKAQYAELVDYAAARFVTVVPEIDMPGHTRAALASIPELNCDGQAPAPYTGTSVGISSLCIGLPVTETFVRDVIGEVAAMTPGPYLHVGGDEAKKTPDADYMAFMTMVRGVVESTGKRMVGWEEIGRIAPSEGAIAQHWADGSLATAASSQGASVLMSPASRAYLDMKYDLRSPDGIGTFWAGFVDVPTGYDWDPGSWLGGVPENKVAGVESPVWTESLATTADLDIMVFPRMVGHAELGWSPWAGHDVEEYLARLGTHGPRLEAMGIGFFAAPQVTWAE